MSTQLFLPLTAHVLRFTLRATSPIIFNDFKGSALRGAFADVLRRTFCPEWRAAATDAFHKSLCPICQLLSAELDAEANGDVRRPYAMQPPLDAGMGRNIIEPGECFTFGLTLFGDSLPWLPYLILAVGGMGEMGVGKRGARGEGRGAREEVDSLPATHHSPPAAPRGTFIVESIDSLHPLTGEVLGLMGPGERMVRPQTLPITHEDVLDACEEMGHELRQRGNRLRIDFLTPLRLTQETHLAKRPDPLPLFKHIVIRLLDLADQHGGGRPAMELRRDLYPLLEGVQLLQDRTHWWDVKGYSGRIQRQQMLGGLIGHAIYQAEDWQGLLPWLLWGSIAHVGKNVVKGCGIYRVASCPLIVDC